MLTRDKKSEEVKTEVHCSKYQYVSSQLIIIYFVLLSIAAYLCSFLLQLDYITVLFS